jgi:hydroxyquinol 1,2-dioxygenase
VVFGVRESLVAPFASHMARSGPHGRELDVPYHTLDYRFVLQPKPAVSEA